MLKLKCWGKPLMLMVVGFFCLVVQVAQADDGDASSSSISKRRAVETPGHTFNLPDDMYTTRKGAFVEIEPVEHYVSRKIDALTKRVESLEERLAALDGKPGQAAKSSHD